MERKYYLRGLGLGITVTAVIMSVVLPGKQAMTNDEIMARAKELGMVENTVLSNMGNEDAEQQNTGDDRADARDAANKLQNDPVAAESVDDTDSETEDAATQTDGDSINEAEGEIVPETDDTRQNDTGEENPEPENAVGEEIQDNTADPVENDTKNVNEAITSDTVKVITIKSGDSSYTVAKKLADVGVVISAQSFDTYLCQNGYDKRLHTGTFTIPADASDEQIARIVTGLE